MKEAQGGNSPIDNVCEWRLKRNHVGTYLHRPANDQTIIPPVVTDIGIMFSPRDNTLQLDWSQHSMQLPLICDASDKMQTTRVYDQISTWWKPTFSILIIYQFSDSWVDKGHFPTDNLGEKVWTNGNRYKLWMLMSKDNAHLSATFMTKKSLALFFF